MTQEAFKIGKNGMAKVLFQMDTETDRANGRTKLFVQAYASGKELYIVLDEHRLRRINIARCTEESWREFCSLSKNNTLYESKLLFRNFH